MNPQDELSREVAKVKLRADYPKLVEGANSLITASKNIRIELKVAFPGIKFSVTSERYSGGNSIDVAWTDGPTSKQVDAIIRKYQGGSFDGMTDCYDYDNRVFNDLFGRAKYVFARRNYSDAAVQASIDRIAAKYASDPITVEQYRRGVLWALKNGYYVDLASMLNIDMSGTVFNDEALNLEAA